MIHTLLIMIAVKKVKGIEGSLLLRKVYCSYLCYRRQRVKIRLGAIPIHKPRFKGAAAPPHRPRTYPWSLIIGIPVMDRGVTPQSGCPGQIISDSKLRNASKCTVDLITEADDRSMFRGLMIVRVG